MTAAFLVHKLVIYVRWNTFFALQCI